MVTTSYGFAGSLGAADFAKMARYVGPYGVLGSSDWVVTAVSGQRAVSIAAGEAFGWNVRSVSGAAQTVALPTPTAGQWFLIVATRDWGAKTTTPNYIAGPTTTTTTPTVAPTSLPAALNQSPGTLDDQPLAWAWVNNTSTAVTIVDLRTPVADLQQPRFGATVEAATSLPGDFIGQRSFALENGILYRWNGTTWRPWSSDWMIATFTATGINGAYLQSPGYTTNGATYRYVDGLVKFRGNVVLNGSTATVTSQLSITLPVNASTNSGAQMVGTILAQNASDSFNASQLLATFTASAFILSALSGTAKLNPVNGSVPFGEAWAQNDFITWDLTYDPA